MGELGVQSQTRLHSESSKHESLSYITKVYTHRYFHIHSCIHSGVHIHMHTHACTSAHTHTIRYLSLQRDYHKITLPRDVLTILVCVSVL